MIWRAGTQSMTEEEISAAVANHAPWYHQIELGTAIITPGVNDSKQSLAYLDEIGLPRDCSGMRALDIGCRDGFFSFELERRGAEVLGVDYEGPTVTGFSVAAKALRSQVGYLVENVYDLDPDKHGRFDLVLFLGVLYHLRNPMLALDRIRAVVKDGASMFVETQMAIDSQIREADIPAWQFFPGDSLNNDGSNAWAPNEIGLRRVLEECEFTVVKVRSDTQRCLASTVASTNSRLDFFRRLDSRKSPDV